MALLKTADMAAGVTAATKEANDTMLSKVTDIAGILLPATDVQGVTIGAARIAVVIACIGGFVGGQMIGIKRGLKGKTTLGLTAAS